MNQNNLELMKRDIDNVLEYIYDTKDRLSVAKAKFEEGVVINGKTLDDGKIESDLYKLDVVAETLINIRKHCNQKLDLIDKNGNINLGGDE